MLHYFAVRWFFVQLAGGAHHGLALQAARHRRRLLARHEARQPEADLGRGAAHLQAAVSSAVDTQ